MTAIEQMIVDTPSEIVGKGDGDAIDVDDCVLGAFVDELCFV